VTVISEVHFLDVTMQIHTDSEKIWFAKWPQKWIVQLAGRMEICCGVRL